MSETAQRTCVASIVGGAVCGGFAAATSWHVTGFGWQVLDDPHYPLGQATVIDPGSVGIVELFATRGMGHPMPVTNASLALDHAMWGTDPFGWHLTNVAVFALTIASLPWAYHAAGRAIGRRISPWAAAVAALLVASHWCNAEVVGWVSSRKDLCAGLFGVLTLGAAACSAGAESPRASLRWAIAAFVAGLLAIGSKGSALLLPGVLVALGVGARRKALTVAGSLLLLPAAMAGWLVRRFQTDLEALDAGRPLAEDLASIGLAAVGNLERVLWPHPDAPVPLRHLDIVAPADLVAAGVAAVALAVGAALWAARRAVAGRIGAGWLLAVLLLAAWLPVSGVFGQVRMPIADRYVWLPLLLVAGPAAAFAAGGIGAWVALPDSSPAVVRYRRAAAMVAVVAVIAGSTFFRTRTLETWRSAESYAARLTRQHRANEQNIANGAYWVVCNQHGLAAGGFVDYGGLPSEPDPARRVELLCTARERWAACLRTPLTCPGPELACRYRARLRRNVEHAESLLAETFDGDVAAGCAELIDGAAPRTRTEEESR